EAMHTFIEVKKLAFEDRARHYGDPAFGKIPVQQLLDKTYAAERRKLIDGERAAARYDAGDVALRQSDTVYLTTADADGNMVSLIQS
ncbi:MAG: gamma-glutamyltransferase, partial [Phycisphaerales bacterium]|nr:gamma-glutamyltransferase [Phycisphaerales bacterium]